MAAQKAEDNYQRTIVQGVDLASVIGHIDDSALIQKLRSAYQDNVCHVWGVKKGILLNSVWLGIKENDIALAYGYKSIRSSSRILGKVDSPSLALHLWNDESFELVFFLSEPVLWDKAMEDLSNYGYIAGSYKRFSRIGDRYINTIRDDFGSVDEFISSIGGDNAVFNKELSEGTVGITEKQRTDSIGRNPDWTDEEIILALELYFNCGRRQLDSSHKDVIKLSELLNNLSIHSKRKRNKKFRNPNGVATKLGNILSLDPERSGGLPNVSKRDIKVWNEYSTNLEELYARAQKIKNDPIIQGQASDFLKAFDLLEASEGESKINMHNKIERNKTIIRYKKLQVLEKTGKLECEACGFDFQIKYGDVAHGVCECHHIVPLFKLKANTKTTIDDLAILCCNCHQAIHLFDPIISVNKLKTLIGKERKKQMEMLMK